MSIPVDNVRAALEGTVAGSSSCAVTASGLNVGLSVVDRVDRTSKSSESSGVAVVAATDGELYCR